MFPSEINEDGSLRDYQTRGIEMKTVTLDIIIQTQTRTVCYRRPIFNNQSLLEYSDFIVWYHKSDRDHVIFKGKMMWSSILYNDEELKNQRRLLVIFKHNKKERLLKRNTLFKMYT